MAETTHNLTNTSPVIEETENSTTMLEQLSLDDVSKDESCSASSSSANATQSKPICPPESEPTGPTMSPSEFRTFNRLAEHMNMFHNHFRREWQTLYGACEANKRPKGVSIRQYINMGVEFCSHLEMHHGIEERYVFPVLAKKMPAFEKELQLLTQHKQIHAGLEKFEAYLKECKKGEKELRLNELKEIMDTFGTVLWTHLDEEVKELGAANMKKYWTEAEMNRLQF